MKDSALIEKIAKDVNSEFKSDIKKKLNPLYDISQEVHPSVLEELEELFEAVSMFSSKKAISLTRAEILAEIEELIK